MTNQTLTALAIRIAGIFLFIKIFDHFGIYFISIYSAAAMATYDEMYKEPFDRLFFNGTFLIIINCIVSYLLFTKAEWISKKLVKSEKEVTTELNPKSLSSVIFLSVAVVWLATSLYTFPEFLDHTIQLISKISNNNNVKVPDFQLSKYIIRTAIALFLIFKIERISNWIIKKV